MNSPLEERYSGYEQFTPPDTQQSQQDQPIPAVPIPSNQWSCPHCQRSFRSKAGLSCPVTLGATSAEFKDEDTS
ncbi:hypothetical protein M8J75_011765 [Diaphorina citri]|nr:hypothetical protein M8J75_011765 [Diaphorina citri]